MSSEAFEMHGVWAHGGDKGAWVELREVGAGINLETPFNVSPTLTPAQARYLARKLHRLATRAEQRKAGKSA